MMNDKYKIALLVLLAITPFIIGNLFKLIIGSQWPALVPIFSVLFLIYWGWMGFISRKLVDSTWESLLIGNGFGIICLVIILLAELISSKYLPVINGFQPQMYFMPTISISTKTLSIFMSRMTTNGIYGASLLLMVLIYLSGYKIRSLSWKK